MLRLIHIQAKNVFHFSTITSGFCTKAPFRLFNDLNAVKIVGTLISDSHQLQSGAQQFTVKTFDTEDRYSNHTIRVKTKANFTAGQRVFVQGKLISTGRKLSDEKSITTTTIFGEKIFHLENECGGERDENSVSIVANVATDVKMREKDCSFNVVTHFSKENETGENERQSTFHHVLAFDSGVRNYIENNLSKSDRVVICGRIGHMTYTNDDDGRKAYSGFIVAESISKIQRRAKSQAESTDNEKIKEEN
ncbi:uncharacterized protein LOC116340868 [Contarinia nasturtii]|uniref:uncharacterized protein LOC116340868 n=1 Tax=Contarinia nasturtii TaxID=265458 RepID=UPI0012D39E46|nr:uncharacterized protein LOC116340868 [Contarinia nasturtii]